MEHHHCPFSQPQIAGLLHCSHGHEVVRRGGSEIACSCAESSSLCEGLFERLKVVGVAAFDTEDDLTVMPHATLTRIQAGGLCGLARRIDQQASGIPDISALVSRAVLDFGSLDAIPVDDLGEAMTAFQLPRRRRK